MRPSIIAVHTTKIINKTLDSLPRHLLHLPHNPARRYIDFHDLTCFAYGETPRMAGSSSRNGSPSRAFRAPPEDDESIISVGFLALELDLKLMRSRREEWKHLAERLRLLRGSFWADL